MSNNLNNVQGNNNKGNERQIQGVSNNSYMHKCYYGSLARITGADVVDFLQGFIKGLKGEVGVVYSENPHTHEIEGILGIPYKINSQGGRQTNTNGMIPIPGLNSSGGGSINQDVLKSIEKIKLAGHTPTVLKKDDVILFKIDFAAVAAEMLNPERGYEASILNFEVKNQNDMVAVVAVIKSKNSGNANRITRLLQGQKFTRSNNPKQPQRYNGNRN